MQKAALHEDGLRTFFMIATLSSERNIRSRDLVPCVPGKAHQKDQVFAQRSLSIWNGPLRHILERHALRAEWLQEQQQAAWSDEFCTVNNSVETALKKTDQVFACIAFNTRSVCEDAFELLFSQIAIVAFKLLLGAKLQTEVRQFAFTALTVLAWAIFTTIYR